MLSYNVGILCNIICINPATTYAIIFSAIPPPLKMCFLNFFHLSSFCFGHKMGSPIQLLLTW